MPPGGHILWDYDGGSRAGNKAFSVDSAHSMALGQVGLATVPCGCSGAVACPRNRWFRVYPGDTAFYCSVLASVPSAPSQRRGSAQPLGS